MIQFLFIKPFSFYGSCKLKQITLNFHGKKMFSRSRSIFYSENLKCKEGKLSEKVNKYTNCLPEGFLKDQDAPPPFSYSWLQRIGRMDIFSEKIENKANEGKEFLSYDLIKTDPIFRLPRKKKKKFSEENFDLVIGKKKEEKIVLFQNRKVHKKVVPIKEKKKRRNEIFNTQFKKSRITILEVSSFKFSNNFKYLISLILVFLGFFMRSTF